MECVSLLLTRAYSIVRMHAVPSLFAADMENPANSYPWNCSWKHWHHTAVLGMLRANGCEPNTRSISAPYVETQLKLSWTPLLSGCPCELGQGINYDFCNASGNLNTRSQPAFYFLQKDTTMPFGLRLMVQKTWVSESWWSCLGT